jgi:hypothetical protein
MNINLHNPDLYFFLCLFTGIAALLAVICEFPRRKRNSAKALDVVGQRQVNPCRVPSRLLPAARQMRLLATANRCQRRRSVIVRCQPKKSM